VTGEWKRLHNDELRDLCVSHFIRVHMKSCEIGRACGMYGREDRWVQGFGGEVCMKGSTRKT